MKDVCGKKLAIGDKVVTNFRGYTDRLTICDIEGFTSQKVSLSKNGQHCGLKFPHQIAIVFDKISLDVCQCEDCKKRIQPEN